MDSNDEYDYRRIHRDIQKRTRTGDRSWTKGLMLGLVLGVILCTGTTYAVYAGELAYQSAMQFDAPSSPSSFQPPRLEPDSQINDAPRGGSGSGYRARRGHSRGPNLTAE